MIIKIYDGVVINAKTIVSIIPRYDSEPAKYAEAEYSGFWIWKKEVKPRREIKPKKDKYYIKLTFISSVHGQESWLEWCDDNTIDRDNRAKHLTEIALSFDSNFVNKAFEQEILK